jgi:hypothetical protein
MRLITTSIMVWLNALRVSCAAFEIGKAIEPIPGVKKVAILGLRSGVNSTRLLGRGLR